MASNYIRFDWAMKRLLRNKANFAVLEGFLTTLLGESILIQRLLESESNQEDEYDKYNRVDLLAENSKGELILIEVQNNNEYAYFQRMLFGTSKLVTEYINRGEGYDKVRKVYSVNIVYFSLGSGKDVVYHGKTEFRGIHQGDVLELTPFQKQTFKVDTVSQLYPEYYILKVNDFNHVLHQQSAIGKDWHYDRSRMAYRWNGMRCFPLCFSGYQKLPITLHKDWKVFCFFHFKMLLLLPSLEWKVQRPVWSRRSQRP